MNNIEIIRIALPVLITVIGNLIFYILIKAHIDKSVELHKIAYSGVFKEKIELYKVILQRSYDLRNKVYTFQFKDSPSSLVDDIWNDFNEFKRFYSINTPFLTQTVLKNLEELCKELQNVFTVFQNMLYTKDKKIVDSENAQIVERFFEASKKLRRNNPDNPFTLLEANIHKEVKKELRLT